MICASVYLLVFIQNLPVHLAENILLMQPLTFGGDYPGTRNCVCGVNNAKSKKPTDVIFLAYMLSAICWANGFADQGCSRIRPLSRVRQQRLQENCSLKVRQHSEQFAILQFESVMDLMGRPGC